MNSRHRSIGNNKGLRSFFNSEGNVKSATKQANIDIIEIIVIDILISSKNCLKLVFFENFREFLISRIFSKIARPAKI